jgi:preprotein translocase subunit SecF
MMEIIKPGTKFDFVSKFKITSVISTVLVVISLWAIFFKLNYGVDFKGGAEIQAKFNQQVTLDEIRKSLKSYGHKGASVQTIGELEDIEVLIKVAGTEQDLNQVTQKVSESLKKDYAAQGIEIRKIDIVGAKAGAALRVSGFQSMLWALLAIMLYIGLRFDFKYSPGAIVALFHDVSIILGIFAFTGTDFTLQTVAALLAVIGYSVNDTVIVYDRVREHEQKDKQLPLSTHINEAINETLSRTILTSGTTLFISLTMFFMGGLAIRDFFLCISLGVIIGTYSSIFIAAPATLAMEKILGKAN